MTARRRLLVGSLLLSLAAWAALVARPPASFAWLGATARPADGTPVGDGPPHLVAASLETPDVPLAVRIEAVGAAVSVGAWETLQDLMQGDDAAAYLAATALANADGIDDRLRIDALERELALHVAEPLDRSALPSRWIGIGRLAERTGDLSRASTAYRNALPDPQAVEGWLRTQADPYVAAAALLTARAYEAALGALQGLEAPSIEAPALRALARYEEADDAYRRWIDEDPDHQVALLGWAWTAWFLGDLERAEERFAQVADPSARYGLGLIANRRGDVATAAEHLVATGDPQRLWLATTLLERAGSLASAIDVYLQIATSTSALADDAAYRAIVLARRTGDEAAERTASSLLPERSFFTVATTGTVALPDVDDLPRPSDEAREALDVTAWLTTRGDDDAARVVAAFALRNATSESDVVTLGEALATLGDHTQPARRASTFVSAGSRQLRTWRLVYPRAFSTFVAREAKRSSVDPSLVWAVMKKESAFYPGAVSRSGAQGLMQVMPATWDWLAEIQGEPPGRPYDPATNVRYGTAYLAYLLDYFGGDLELAIASYNRGQGYISRLFDGDEVQRDRADLYRAIDAEETREYLQSVYLHYLVYDGLARVEADLSSR